MFSGCSSLREVDISNLNTMNVSHFDNMFSGCSSLNEIKIFGFNTNVEYADFERMFFRCPEELKTKIRNKYKNIKEEAFSDK